MKKNNSVYIAGHTGLIGSAIHEYLKKKLDQKKIIVINSKKLNLLNQLETFDFLKKKKPKKVIIAAAKVGGIKTNNELRAEFIYENLQIQNNLIHGSFKAGVKDLIFLGSSCIYPKFAKQPIKEKYLLKSYLEKTNEPYAVAKIAGLKMCESYNKQYGLNYKCLMPCNMYGPKDNYDIETSHFFPAIIKKFYLAMIKGKKNIDLWGDGTPKRELMYSEDLAEACNFFINKKTKETLINVGSGKDMTIKQYAYFIKDQLNLNIDIKFNNQKVINGTPRKLLDIGLAKSYGWKPKTSLKLGFSKTYNSFLEEVSKRKIFN